MEVVDQKMRDLMLRTPERRQPRNSSILSTPGLPMVDHKSAASPGDIVYPAQDYDLYPISPAACAFPVVVPHRIFVGGFHASTTEHELRSYFERFGDVRDVKIIRDETENTKPKYNYGFITFATEEEAKKIIEMNKTSKGQAFKFQGRYLNVNMAVKKPPHKLRIETSALPSTGLVCRDQNGQLLTVYPSYTVVPNPEFNVVQPQCMNVAPPMLPMVVSPPVYQMAPPPQPLPTVGQIPTPVSYSQYGGQATCSTPVNGYYQ